MSSDSIGFQSVHLQNSFHSPLEVNGATLRRQVSHIKPQQAPKEILLRKTQTFMRIHSVCAQTHQTSWQYWPSD